MNRRVLFFKSKLPGGRGKRILKDVFENDLKDFGGNKRDGYSSIVTRVTNIFLEIFDIKKKQSIYQSINQCTNQSINQFIKCTNFLFDRSAARTAPSSRDEAAARRAEQQRRRN